MVYYLSVGISTLQTFSIRGGDMKKIGDILAIIGIILFIYTIVGRFVGEKSILGLSQIPWLGRGFTAVGMFAGTACLLLIAVIAYLKAKD